MWFGKYIKKKALIWEISMSIASYSHRLEKLRDSNLDFDVDERLMLIGRIDALSLLAHDMGIENEVDRDSKMYLSRLVGFGHME